MGTPSRFGPEQADELAAKALGTLRTKLGGLHIDHARRIAAVVEGDDERAVVVALLHDVVEKTPMTHDELAGIVGDSTVMELVDLLTQRPDESDPAYLRRCASDPTAYVLKRLDLADKLIADDSTVPATTAEALRAQALERLALLDTLAAASRHSRPDHPCGPRQGPVA